MMGKPLGKDFEVEGMHDRAGEACEASGCSDVRWWWW
jgi:hypothetical protein